MSVVWQYFKKSLGAGICKLCHKTIKTAGNTTNLRNHIIKVHKIDLEENDCENSLRNLQFKDKQNPIKDYFCHKSSAKKFKHASENEHGEFEMNTHVSGASEDIERTLGLEIPSTSRSNDENNYQITIDKAFQNINSFSNEKGTKFNIVLNSILFLIAKENLPFSFIESEAFINLMKVTCPKFNVPCRNTIKAGLGEKYDELSKVSKENLKLIDKVVITTNIWTHIQTTRSYLGVTAHYLKNFELHNV